MLKIIKSIPFIIWLKWLYYYFKAKKTSKKVSIGYRSYVIKCELGNVVRICDDVYFSNSSIGDFSYLGDGCKINNTNIGKFCSISSNVNIGLGKHPTHFVSTSPLFYSTKNQLGTVFSDNNYFSEYVKTNIGNDVWIGANVVILDGVTIGNGAIIATGSIVSKDVGPFEIVGGIPSKLIRKRFSDSDISLIENSKWWNRDADYLRKNFKKFHDIDGFRELNNDKF